MNSKRLKEIKEIHDEVISKNDFLDIFNGLVKIENDIKKWAKEAKTHMKKYEKKRMY